MLPFVEKRLVEPQDLALRVLDLMPLEGVTLGGGEPFLQASALAEFVETLKAGSNLSCLTYSGYTLDEIRQSKEKGWRKLLSLTDILIDGEYIEDLPSDDLLWRGSSNQNIHLLTSRYKGLKETDFKKKAGDLEFHLTQDGELVMIGVPQRGFFRRFKEKLSEQGIMLEEEYPS